MNKKVIIYILYTLFFSTLGLAQEQLLTESDTKYKLNNHLRVATLNIAHGRKDSISQFFLTKKKIIKNLNDISDVLNRHKPQVVALQEADLGQSFNHVEYLALHSQYQFREYVSNVDFWPFSYGTGILSILPVSQTIKYTFDPSPPTFNKGFILTQLDWAISSSNSIKIDIISVHLDFSRQSIREKQIQEMLNILSSRNNPTIIMGDFNSEWLNDEAAIKKLLKDSHFSSYKPQSSELNTYKNKRLDWILITKELEFVKYEVLADTLSDHSMVIAEIRYKTLK